MDTSTTIKSGILHKVGVKFTPKWLPTLTTCLLVPLFCSMGTWQWHRAHEKRELLNAYRERQNAAPLTLSSVTHPALQEYYPIKISGLLDASRQLLVDNKYYQHRLGYVVLTPLQLPDQSVVLVNRGWVAREEVNQLDTSQRETTIQGIIHVLPQKIFQLGQIPAQKQWPKTIQNASWAEITRVMPNTHFHKFMILLEKDSKEGLIPIYKPSIMPPEKHLGYAFQWFAMAVTILVLFIVLNLRRVDHANHQ